jgi:F-type H+-transporting ATPase subunit epsilon
MAFQVEFVSPETSLYSGEGTQVVARTRGGGEIAFLTGHEPFVGSLQASEVRVSETSGHVQSFAVRSGFVSVSADKVTVLSDEAMPSHQIDLDAARADLEAAQVALSANADDAYAREDVRWAALRIRLAAGGGGAAAQH